MFCRLQTTVFILIVSLFSVGIQEAQGEDEELQKSAVNGDCVILLHGLARTGRSMERMEEALSKEGYLVVNMDYPSREKTIEKLSLETIVQGLTRCRQNGTRKVHFVTHSMGGILVRYYLKHHRVEQLGRVVMLAPPNGGSEVVDKLRDYFFFQWINGPAGQQLGTGSDSLPLQLGPVDYPVGIIIGDRHLFYDWYHAGIIPGKDDGKVSIERAKLAGMSDFLVVPHGHSFVMEKRGVIDQSLFFLKHGRFQKNKWGTQP